MSEESENLVVNLHMRPMDGDVELRQVFLGYEPIIIIEPNVDEAGDVSFSIDATGLDQEELAIILAGIAEVLEKGSEV